MGLGIKKNDTVLVITGREKGKKGRVISLYPSKDMLLIERTNIIKRHMKPSKKYTQGGIIEKEAPLHMSNVMLICPKCGKPTRIGNTVLSDGKKTRACKKCKEVIE
ncbi:MAG TPA: 50S ribosomal protein L24 [Thermodesulfovibrionales bacterium]|nr:50S ribosomal protein L24 [Thermodesulfovibrionales bacterium]